MSSILNPYTNSRSVNDKHVKKWSRVIAESRGIKQDEVVSALTKQSADPKHMRQRVQFNQQIFIAEACAHQAKIAMLGVANQLGESPASLEKKMITGEALSSGTNALADTTSFTTQMIIMSMSIFPRLLANDLFSIQPLMQPAGYVFAMKHVDDTGRDLSDLALFNPTYTADPGEGEQIRKVKTKFSKTLVEASYHKLMWEASWEDEVAVRSQYNMSLDTINDGIVNMELVWEVDRALINFAIAFAARDYYFDPTNGGKYDSMAERDQQAYDDNFLRKTWNIMETEMQHSIFRKPSWAIAGLHVIQFLKRLRKYEAYKQGGSYGDMILTNGSVQFSGTLNDVACYHDPQMDPCLMIVGYVEKMDPFYAGIIFSPFGMASILTEAFRDPNNLLNRKAQALAYAISGIRSTQFARIHMQQCS